MKLQFPILHAISLSPLSHLQHLELYASHPSIAEARGFECDTFTWFLGVLSPNFNPKRNVFKSFHMMFFMIKGLLFSNLITCVNLLFVNQARAVCRLAIPDLVIVISVAVKPNHQILFVL